MRSSQDGKWMMRWSSTEHLTLLNKMMKLASADYNVQYRKSGALDLGQSTAAQAHAANIHADT